LAGDLIKALGRSDRYYRWHPAGPCSQGDDINRSDRFYPGVFIVSIRSSTKTTDVWVMSVPSKGAKKPSHSSPAREFSFSLCAELGTTRVENLCSFEVLRHGEQFFKRLELVGKLVAFLRAFSESPRSDLHCQPD
jgi:hypothetical protein